MTSRVRRVSSLKLLSCSSSWLVPGGCDIIITSAARWLDGATTASAPAYVTVIRERRLSAGTHAWASLYLREFDASSCCRLIRSMSSRHADRPGRISLRCYVDYGTEWLPRRGIKRTLRHVAWRRGDEEKRMITGSPLSGEPASRGLRGLNVYRRFLLYIWS